jgi:tetratricopeptide (TPR) repeat protein
VSRSPTEAAAAGGAADYRAAWGQLTTFMRQGRSLSGRERHCCFLNTRGLPFVDVSSATGLDLIDDGRGVALVDWDHDGDQDIWLLNRTGPQVRFLRNDVPTDNHYLDLRLVGDPAQGTNRDAIGARVELHLGGTAHGTRIGTVAAGNSFLSQSSKWLHFGLGKEQLIEQLVVHWPGRGESESFSGLEIDGRYRIVQGAGRAEAWSPARRTIALEPSTPEVPALSERARVVLLEPSPTLDFELPSGPVLLNLWAGWCAPCIAELREIAAGREALTEAGVTVVALNVEQAGDPDQYDASRAMGLLESFDFPFPADAASPAQLARLQGLADELLYFQRPLTLPSSFLLDDRHQVAVIYKGPVELAQVVNDTRNLRKRPARIQDTDTPFPGWWTEDRFTSNARSIAAIFREMGDPDGAFSPHMAFAGNFIAEGRATQAAEHLEAALEWRPHHGPALDKLGNLRYEAGAIREAVELYQRAIEADRGAWRTANNLAWIRATHPDPALRDGAQAVRLAMGACDATAHADPSVLGTLAASQAEAGEYAAAVDTTDKALALLTGTSDQVRESLLAGRQLYVERRPYRDPMFDAPARSSRE